LPFTFDNSKKRVSNVESRNRNSLHLVVKDLKETDSGNYTCEAKPLMDSLYFDPSTEYVDVRVKPKIGTCSEPLFSCPSGECIGRIYLCDGKADCKDGSDESERQCGTWNRNPCEGKLRCENGRCISKHWCCDKLVDRNCTVRTTPKCCMQLQSLNLDVNQYSPQPQQYSDMGFLQTTIYTVIGCAMVFMLIITIMVIAICRVHLKRTAIARYPHHLSQAAQRQDSWGNIFLHAGGGLPYTSAASGLLVTYNINNGVQFVGRPVNPPPYSEILRVPPREGPPPPYASNENIANMPSSSTGGFQSEGSELSHNSPNTDFVSASRARGHLVDSESDSEELSTLQPLLSDNNNGDINGNNMEDVLVQPDRNSPIGSQSSIATMASNSINTVPSAALNLNTPTPVCSTHSPSSSRDAD
jgi:hypothetical protein